MLSMINFSPVKVMHSIINKSTTRIIGPRITGGCILIQSMWQVNITGGLPVSIPLVGGWVGMTIGV